MFNKKIACLGLVTLSACLSTWASAEILIILPQTGPMANASESIKRGLFYANLQASKPYQLRFVDSQQDSIQSILKKQVRSSTELVVGPLEKKQVESLIKLKPKVKILALNQVDGSAANVYQFALAKDEDAKALTEAMRKKGVEEIVTLREENTAQHTQSFYEAMHSIWEQQPAKQKSWFSKFSDKHQGVLVLGSGAWVSQQDLPKKNIYTLAYAIEEKQAIPEGMVFCDTPALYTNQWSDVIRAYQLNPVSMPYQRLIAFGGDAWQLADALIQQKKSEKIAFDGRTGRIELQGQKVQRQPQCFEYHKSKIKQL